MVDWKPMNRRKALLSLGSAAAAVPLAKLLGVDLKADAGAAEATDHGMVHGGGQASSPVGSMDPGTALHEVHSPPVSAGPHDFDHLLYPPKPRRFRRGAVREYTLVAEETDLEVASGINFAGWTYADQALGKPGTAPGPIIRVTEGELLRVKLVNASSHPHSIHFHGIHPANMDGVFEQIEPGKSFMYEFEAKPAGMQLYHCHSNPLKKHIHKGLYGAFIIDPKELRKPAKELVMVMNGFDTDGDGSNNIYSVNGVAFYYVKYPIRVRKGELVRIYLANLTEFDLINSFHLHGEFFRYYPTGTREDHYLYTDTITQCQGERGIVEFEFSHAGKFMFHAHQTEFTDLGWMGFFEVVE